MTSNVTPGASAGWPFNLVRAQSSKPKLKVRVLQDRNATVAEVTYGEYVATGSSKRNKGEVFDPEAGRVIAEARAFDRLARMMAATLGLYLV